MTPNDIAMVRQLAKDIKHPEGPVVDGQDAAWLREFASRMTTDRKKLIAALHTALSNFSGADDSEIREGLRILGAKP